MLSISNISKTYSNGVQALKGIDLEIGKGMFGLLGPNGAGKSTLMRTIAALQKPDSGRILFDGINTVDHPQVVRESLGYLPQEFGVYPKISAFKLLHHLAVLKGVGNKAQRTAQVLALLDQTNLLRFRHKAVGSFSGGMKQRFGIAQALLGNPRLIIVDEPTAGLDPKERARFLNLLSEVGQQMVVILSTHMVEDVRELCTQMAILDEGSVRVQGQPDAMIEKLEGMIWRKTVHPTELARFERDHTVLSKRLKAGRPQIHILSQHAPDLGFEQITPGLEDVYFAALLKDKESPLCS